MDRRRGMRWALAVGLLSVAGSGCNLFTPKATRAIMDKPRAVPIAVAATSEHETRLGFHTRLVDQPAGSAYLNAGLWIDAIDPLTHEQTTLLALNGLRLAVFTGPPPAELERLAKSEATVLSPMMRSGVVGKPRVIPVNGPIEKCTVGAVSTFNAEAKPTVYELAECGLSVTATALPDDKLKVRDEFQIQHGARLPWLRPTSDGSGFARTDQRAAEAYPALAFEVILGRSDLLVMGASDDPAEKLGQAFFFSQQSDRIRQRVLLLQVGTLDRPGDPQSAKSKSSAAQTGRGLVFAGK